MVEQLQAVIAKAALGEAMPRAARNLDAVIASGRKWRETLDRLERGDGSTLQIVNDPYANDDRDTKLLLAYDAIEQELNELRSGIYGRDGRAAPAPEAAEAFIATVRGDPVPLQVPNFRKAAEQYVAAHKAGWRNPKHQQQWESTLATYAYPILGSLPVDAVTTDHVVQVLKPIWQEKTETASRLRGRIETILDYAGTRGWRSGENPARWKGHLSFHLPKKGKIAPIEHHAALPWQEVAAFATELRRQEGIAAECLLWVILTGCRTGEALGATWQEIDFANRVWTIPAERMKAGREHRVPLSDAALALLQRLKASRLPRHGEWLFPGQKGNAPITNMGMLTLLRRMKRNDLTVHGFRSTFRDWAAEATDYPSEVAEMALAHTIGSKVEAAYRRGDLFEKRRRLMQEWGAAVVPT